MCSTNPRGIQAHRRRDEGAERSGEGTAHAPTSALHQRVKDKMLHIDGSFGEGGGQILRTSLALSLVTGQPLRIDDIRRGRQRPGLMRQHLAAVRAAAQVGSAQVKGDHLGSTALTFRPGTVRAGDYSFSIGSAGSATLVLQTVLPALIRADGPSTIELEGGTHNPAAPPFDYIERTFLPALRRIGGEAQVTLARHGFYPAGGGRFTAHVQGSWQPRELVWNDRGTVETIRARAIVSKLPPAIAARELTTLTRALDRPCETSTHVVENPMGPGNALVVDVVSEEGITVLTGFGERGVRAETVARRLAGKVNRTLRVDVPVDEHLADQILPYLALGCGGTFRTVRPSSHTRTQIELLERVLHATIDTDLKDETCLIQVRTP